MGNYNKTSIQQQHPMSEKQSQITHNYKKGQQIELSVKHTTLNRS